MKIIKSKKGFQFGLEQLGYLLLALGALALFAWILYMSFQSQGGIFGFIEELLGL